MAYYRIQDEEHISEMLNPEFQFSMPGNGDEDKMRTGVSCCGSVAELAAYFATSSLVISNPVLVKIDGPESDDEALDAEWGEYLIHPETCEVMDLDFYEMIGPLVDIVWDNGWDISDHRDIVDAAEDLFGHIY